MFVIKRAIMFFLTSLFVTPGFNQVAPDKYVITFTDKNHNNYSLSNPEKFLSAKALERRKRYNIPIEYNDLPVSDFYLDSLKNLGLKILNSSKWFNSVTVYTRDSLLMDSIHTISFIQATRKKSQINHLVHANGQEQFLLKNKIDDYGYGWWQIAMLNGDYLHEAGYRGKGMDIAVLDAGFYRVDSLPGFDSAWHHNRIAGYKDFVLDHLGIFNSNHHGMKVLSIMAGNIPGTFIGTAPAATYWLARSEDYFSEYTIEEENWIAAAEYADSAGVDIINSSLGYSTFNDTSQNYTYLDMNGNTARVTKAADIAASKGILVVTSAGNEGNKDWQFITAPGDADSALTVGATDSLGFHVSFSSTGPTADSRIKPNVAALGYGTIVQYAGGGFGPGTGTSFSSPVIAGLAACLWQAHPDKSNMEILHAIEASANQYLNPDSLLGYGVPDFRIADMILREKNENLIDIEAINIYPNPFKNNVNIEIPGSPVQEIEIEIYDSLGRLVREKKYPVSSRSKNLIEISDLKRLESGMYIFNVKTNHISRQKKMIKENEQN